MDWKKEIKSWAIILGVFGIIYAMGWYAPIMGKLQSIVLSTGLIKPNLEKANEVGREFDYSGKFLDLDGQLVDLQSYRNQTIFINLWATWCPPCIAEMPHIESLYQKMKDNESISFLMINLDEDPEKPVRFIAKKEYTFPVVHASYGITPSLRHQSIPTTLVISPEGKIIFRQEGMSNFDTEEFREFLLNGPDESN